MRKYSGPKKRLPAPAKAGKSGKTAARPAAQGKTGKRVRVTVRTDRTFGLRAGQQSGGRPPAASGLPEQFGIPPAEEMPEAGNDSTVTVSDGLMASRAGRVRLTYAEPSGVRVGFSFDREEPGLLMMTREGGSEQGVLMLVFEQGVRHICMNRVDGETFEITTFASRLENRLASSGTLALDYTVELHGVRVERTSIEITAEKAD